MHKDLRVESAKFISSKDLPGNAIGVCQLVNLMKLCMKFQKLFVVFFQAKTRYLMGVGTPGNLIENISLGIDMFDCVMPTRNARNGMLFTSEGTINIKNEKWKNDHTIIDPNGKTFVDNSYTKAYLRHLFSINENLGKQIATIHNLGFYKWIIEKAKEELKKIIFYLGKIKL